MYGKEGYALVDIMTGENEPQPKVIYEASLVKLLIVLPDISSFINIYLEISLWVQKKDNGQIFFPAIWQVGERILCRHPFSESKRAYVVPQRVEELLKCFWSGNSGRSCYLSKCINFLVWIIYFLQKLDRNLLYIPNYVLEAYVGDIIKFLRDMEKVTTSA